jgi:SAM-dependent methyltransferase
VLDVGCGSGLLARVLLAEGYAVRGIDASPAMIELAHAHAPAGAFNAIGLPTRRRPGEPGSVPAADAIVSTGHVLNYLDSRDDLALALTELASALRPGGLLVMDLMTERFCDARDLRHPHAKVEDDWTIVTRFSRPGPHRFDRDITIFRRVNGAWRRSDEHHGNVTFEVDEAIRILRERGVDARPELAFGDEPLPEGLVVISGTRLS